MKAVVCLLGSIIGLVAGNVSSRFLRLPQGEFMLANGTYNGTFKQLIDHSNPSLGTFSQRWWVNDTFWNGPGSPVVLFTPGEESASGYGNYLTTNRLTGLIGEAIGAAVVMIEHRYWGESSPYEELTTKNLQYLTLSNAIADLTYFANNVVFPFDTNGSSHASEVPWILVGGSYSGALTAWVESVAPGTFWAYLATSAVVEAVYDFWEYFAPIQEGMAKNCSSDINSVVNYIDDIARNGTAQEQQELKERFGLGDLKHMEDFAEALASGPYQWQSNQFYTDYSSFFQFCDYVENAINVSNSSIPGASGVGLQKALDGYARWMKEQYLPGFCASSYGYWTSNSSVECFDTYNASSRLFTDLAVNNTADRQWYWMLCNEPFAFWQTAAPKDVPTLVSRLVTPEYSQRQCDLYFPPEGNYTYGSALGKTVKATNLYTGGWYHTNTTRLIWTNGQYDPWKDATVSSETRPGGPFNGTATAPVNIIPSGIHCSDLVTENGRVNEGVQRVIDAEIAQIKEWVAEYAA